jgi:hypothetical protein
VTARRGEWGRGCLAFDLGVVCGKLVCHGVAPAPVKSNDVSTGFFFLSLSDAMNARRVFRQNSSFQRLNSRVRFS